MYLSKLTLKQTQTNKLFILKNGAMKVEIIFLIKNTNYVL